MSVEGVVASTDPESTQHLTVNNKGVIDTAPTSNLLTSCLAIIMGPSRVRLCGFSTKTLERLSVRLPISIGVVTHAGCHPNG